MLYQYGLWCVDWCEKSNLKQFNIRQQHNMKKKLHCIYLWFCLFKSSGCVLAVVHSLHSGKAIKNGFSRERRKILAAWQLACFQLVTLNLLWQTHACKHTQAKNTCRNNTKQVKQCSKDVWYFDCKFYKMSTHIPKPVHTQPHPHWDTPGGLWNRLLTLRSGVLKKAEAMELYSPSAQKSCKGTI